MGTIGHVQVVNDFIAGFLGPLDMILLVLKTNGTAAHPVAPHWSFIINCEASHSQEIMHLVVSVRLPFDG